MSRRRFATGLRELLTPGVNGSGGTVIDGLLFRFSVFLVPVAIALMTLAALAVWPARFANDGGQGLDFAVVADPGGSFEPHQARARLAGLPRIGYLDTHLSEAPFWFVFDGPLSPAVGGHGAQLIEFPSRHAREVSCWDAATLDPLGRGSRASAEGGVRQAKAGFFLIPAVAVPAQVLCRSQFSGPARLTVRQWTEGDFDLSIAEFHRELGLLDGGLLILTLFVLITALINREWIYVLFAAWLMGNLRIAALSAGFDTLWFGHEIPATWMFLVRKFSMAAYCALTIMLFSRLLAAELRQVGYGRWLNWVKWSNAPLMLCALVLSYGQFLPVFWLLSVFSVGSIIFLMVRILMVTRSPVAIWYAISIAITVGANFNEVVAASLGIKALMGLFNSVTAALISSLMAALAIAEQMHQERLGRLRAEAELRNTYEAIPIGLFTLDTKGCFLRVNPAMRTMVGVADFSGRHWGEFFGAGTWGNLDDALRGRASGETEISVMEGGQRRYFLVKATATDGHVEGSLQDITQRTLAAKQLQLLADHDPLTGILNRRGLEVAFNRISDSTLCLAYLDLDRFKLINDLYGHAAGDEILIQICRQIEGALEPEGFHFGRVGGDEFVIAFNTSDMSVAERQCRAILRAVFSEPFKINAKAFIVNASIGLIEVTPGILLTEAISAADRACRTAKEGGPNELVVYRKDAPVFAERAEELRIIQQFGTHAAPEGLVLHGQPIMSLRAPFDSLNFEFLLRMRDPDSGLISSAYKVIKTAETSGRISLIDRWVFQRALEWLDEHHAALVNTRVVNVNLSGASLNDMHFVEDIFAMLAQHPRAAALLCIEITESVALHDIDTSLRFVDRAKQYGARVALDDFGAGYTSFSYLRHLPADALKIDGQFVLGATAHPANMAIVEAISDLAHNFGMQSIAEWAEDISTVQAMVEAGIDHLQGYIIALPQPLENLLAACSGADFIQDPVVAAYVKTLQDIEPWGLPELGRRDLH